MLDQVLRLAELLRADDLDVSTGDVIDATTALTVLPLDDRTVVREALRSTLVKQTDPTGVFDRCFARAFTTNEPTGDRSAPTDTTTGTVIDAPAPSSPAPGQLDDAVLRALLDADDAALAALAAQAVDAYGGIDGQEGSERYFLHRVLRALDLSRMLSAAMQQLRREGELTELELSLARQELTERLEEFRRRLAVEVARLLADHHTDSVAIPERTNPDGLDLLAISRADADEMRRLLQPILRRIAAQLGRKRRARPTGRLDVRRTVRRSLAFGGVPMDVVTKRRHPHRPDIVVLCDVSGSVAEFAQFTFTLINALHADVKRVRSFAFVDGCAEVTDVFATAHFNVSVNRLVERRGVVGLDGHSDYGAVFRHFSDTYLDDAVGSGTTVIVTGDARNNYRAEHTDALGAIAERARRVYWLNPEPEHEWDTTDSVIGEYRTRCTKVLEVRTLGQLADALAELV
jgi:uncharacterized protein